MSNSHGSFIWYQLRSKHPEASRARPKWLGNLGVDHVDDTVRKVVAAGGKVRVAKWR